MDLERAMEFIVERQAAAEVEMAEMRRMSAKTDRKVDALGKLVRVGMRILAKQDERLAKHERELAEERKRSDQRFQQLVQSFVRALRNGR